jgi:hypothetical protein
MGEMMKVSKLLRNWVVIAVVLLFPTSPQMESALAFQQEQEPNNPPPFAGYPRSSAFRYAISTHVDPTRSQYKKSPLLFSATFFLTGDSERAAEQLQIFKDGHVFSVLSVYAWAEQAAHWAELSSSEQGRISELIETVGQVEGKPPLVDLLIVSFSRNGAWTSVLLDRNKLPESIRRIYAMTGARTPIRIFATPGTAP